MTEKRQVVLTGLGCVSPAGNDVASTWESLVAGRSAVQRLPWLEEETCACKIGAPVRDFHPENVKLRQDIRRLGRSTQFAMAAALEAHRDAGLAGVALDPSRCGVIVGTGIGDAADHFIQTRNYLSRGARSVHPLYVTRVMPNAAAAALSMEFDYRGPNFTAVSACSAAGHAIAIATRLIQSGDVDLVISGGAEEISSILNVAAFDAMHALSRRNDDPPAASRPFDRDRDGFVLAEGAGIIILEERGHALRRGARIHARIAGIGMASDAHHMTVPEPQGEGAVSAMRAALNEAARDPGDLQYINAHGTSTPLNDRIETLAIRRLLGDRAESVCVSSTKSMIGHTIGASAAFGLIAAVLSIGKGVIHPTINLRHADPGCDLDYVPNEARRVDVRLALVNSFGFGGHCVSLAVERFQDS